jgi:hypothetical protein
VKQIPFDPRKVSEITELFFGDKFFEMLSKDTNLYYFQNQGEYDSSSKELKWVGVSVIHATHKKGVKPGTFVNSAYCSSTKKIFPQITHPQALLGALVSVP